MPEGLWKKVTVQVPLQMLDPVSDFMVTLTGRGVCTREDERAAFIDAYMTPGESKEQMLHIQRFVDDLFNHGHHPEEIALRIEEIPEEDWMSVFRSQHGPVRVSDRLVVRPTWCDPVGTDDLVLDPGLAFGTGSHLTTRMCLELLDGLPDIPSRGRLLDLGTGSGILAIAGAFLGFTEVLAVDIDPVAVNVALANVRDNSSEDIIRVKEGSIESAEGVYEVITANLSGSLLVKLAERVSPHLAEGGHLIASGITTGEKESVISSFTRCGLDTVRVMEEDVWVGMLFRKG